MKTQIQNVGVSARKDTMDNKVYLGFSLSWEQPGCRYHVWCDADHKPNENFYKNPPLGVDYKSPDYFRARVKSTTAAANARMIAEAVRIADRGNLWQLAIDNMEAEKLAENVKRLRATMAEIRKAAAPELYKATKMLLRLTRDLMPGIKHLALQDYAIVNNAPLAGDAALAACEPTSEDRANWIEWYGQEAFDAAMAQESADE